MCIRDRPSLVSRCSDGVHRAVIAVDCGDVCAVSNLEKLMNGRDFAADDSTAILDS